MGPHHVPECAHRKRRFRTLLVQPEHSFINTVSRRLIASVAPQQMTQWKAQVQQHSQRYECARRQSIQTQQGETELCVEHQNIALE